MGLTLSQIEFENFRNYSEFKSEPFGSLNIFVGPNGAGKTNIIEGIQLMTSLCSFRNPKWDEVILRGERVARIAAHVAGGGRDLEMGLSIADRKRRYSLNGKAKKSGSLRGLIPAVLFCPDDLQLVKGSAEVRRDGLDSVGSQISSTYYDLKKEYQRTIKQKNKLLQLQDVDISLIDTWNENITLIATSYVKHRLRLYSAFSKNLLRIWLDLSPKLDLRIVYIPSWEVSKDIEVEEPGYNEDEIREKIGNTIRSHRDAEIAAGRSLVGPHKDDIRFYIDGADARRFASQGQQRYISLAWKIAEMETISEICDQKPLLLLDDVLSELDREKKSILMNYLYGKNQTFITSTDVDALDDRILSEANVFTVGSKNEDSTGN